MAAPLTVPEAGDVRSGRWLGAPGLPVSMSGEERLARLVGEGHERAFGVLYERYHQPLYRYCRSLVHSDIDAQDALQSTFMAALGALRRAQRDAPLRPWLFRIAHNESISLLRRRRPEEALSEAIESTVPSAEHSAEGRARLASLVTDLGDLPERQRGALLMRELSGLSHEQIAEAFGISVGAAKQTVFEARRSLMEFAEGRAMACEQIQRVISDGDGRARRARRVRAHLRDCSCCAAFAAAIPGREEDLRALAPVLPVATAAGILARVTGAGTGHGSGAGASMSGVAASATGKAATTVVSLKAVTAGVAVVAAAAAGAAGALHKLPTQDARSSAASRGAHTTHGQASRTPGRSAASGAPAAGHIAAAGALSARPSSLSAAAATSPAGAKDTATRGHSGTASAHGAGSGARRGQSGAAPNRGASPGNHLGTVTHPSAGNRLGTVKHTGTVKHPRAGSGGGATHRPSSHPQKPAVVQAPPSSSSAGPGSDHAPAGQTTAPASAPSGSQSSGGTQPSSTAGSSDAPASSSGLRTNTTGQLQTSTTGSGN